MNVESLSRLKIFLFQEKSDDNWSMGPVQQEVGGEDGGVQ